jgi:hypothetical protein
MKRTCQIFSVVATIACGSISSLAQDAPSGAPKSILANQGEASGADLLGAPFENESAGISLRLPAGCHRTRSTGEGDDIGQFGDEKRQWQLKLTRITRPQPTVLASTVNNFGDTTPGLLDITADSLKRHWPGCTILRQDLTNTRDGNPKLKNNVGMIAVRYSAAGGHYLTQQAIIQSSDRLFYLLALTTPASDLTGDAADNDPIERTPVETFRQMLDSVRLLDTAKLHQDQVDRLIRTRSLMVNWTSARLHAALVDEQWLRIMRDGKDVGYSYITEQTAGGVPRPLRLEEVKAGKSDRDLVQPGDGILIGVRARTLAAPSDASPSDKPKAPVQVDSASWLFVTPDRKLEDWSRILVVDDGSVDKDGKSIKSQTEEFGSSNRQVIRSFDKEGAPGTKLDPHQPAIKIREQYMLDVTTVSQSGQGDPVNQELPPFYLPQALGQLLPQLLPLHPEIGVDGAYKPRSYLFATYVPDTREVMLRYVDVGDERSVTFAGRTLRAIPISDRIGWHGSITTHYMSANGLYLGSENKESHLMMLPTDANDLLTVWKNANLTRPGGVEKPAGSARGLFEVPSTGTFGPQEAPTK